MEHKKDPCQQLNKKLTRSPVQGSHSAAPMVFSCASPRTSAAVVACRAELASWRVEDALEPAARDLLVVYENSTVGDALISLCAWNVLSAPVVKGSPPWLEAGAHKAARQTGWPEGEAGADNPLMSDVLGFLSVANVVHALVAATQGVSCDDVAAVRDAAAELWRSRVTEAFDVDALAMDWEVLGAAEGDNVQSWAPARGVCTPDRSFLQVVRRGFLTPKGAHRIAVWAHLPPAGEPAQAPPPGDKEEDVSPPARLVNVFSQSDAVAFIMRQSTHGPPATRDALGAILDLPLSSLGLGGWAAPLIAVPAETPLLAALRTLCARGVSGAAVVDGEGRLLANLSVSDVRKLLMPPVAPTALSSPVVAMLEATEAMRYHSFSGTPARGVAQSEVTQSHRAALARFRRIARSVLAPRRGEAQAEEPRRAVALNAETATLRDAVQMMLQGGLHRAYTVRGGDDAPLGVVTLTDVLRCTCGTGEGGE